MVKGRGGTWSREEEGHGQGKSRDVVKGRGGTWSREEEGRGQGKRRDVVKGRGGTWSREEEGRGQGKRRDIPNVDDFKLSHERQINSHNPFHLISAPAGKVHFPVMEL